MTAPNVDSSRRNFLKAAAGTATVSAASGTAAAAEGGGGNNSSSGGGGGGGQPDWGGYMEGANNYEGSTVDKRGQDSVTIKVGAGDGLAFGPAAVWVSTGTTVTWEWTGQGGAHNVVSDESDIDSGSPTSEAGHTYEVTFKEGGLRKYHCVPHQSSGMYGGVAVGDSIPTVQPDTGGGGVPTMPDSAKMVGVATGVGMVSTLGLAYFFMKYGNDYEGDV